MHRQLLFEPCIQLTATIEGLKIERQGVQLDILWYMVASNKKKYAALLICGIGKSCLILHFQ